MRRGGEGELSHCERARALHIHTLPVPPSPTRTSLNVGTSCAIIDSVGGCGEEIAAKAFFPQGCRQKIVYKSSRKKKILSTAASGIVCGGGPGAVASDPACEHGPPNAHTAGAHPAGFHHFFRGARSTASASPAQRPQAPTRARERFWRRRGTEPRRPAAATMRCAPATATRRCAPATATRRAAPRTAAGCTYAWRCLVPPGLPRRQTCALLFSRNPVVIFFFAFVFLALRPGV